MNCKICNSEFGAEKLLHFHIARSHKITIGEYYQTYFPKYDLFTRELIEFKNLNFYQSTLFNNRSNLVQYFKKNPKDEKNLVECIRLRAALKGLEFAPDTVTSRTSVLPSAVLINYLKYDYNSLCEKAGLKARYDYKQILEFENCKLDILQDTRENTPLDLFGCNVTVTKLDAGDYLCKNLYKKVVIERKGFTDFCGSVSGGYERLCAEFERARENGIYIIVLVECSLNELLDYSPPEGTKQRATSEFLCGRVRKLINQFELQFLFVKDRDDAARALKRIFLMKNDIRQVDLQFMFDSGKL